MALYGFVFILPVFISLMASLAYVPPPVVSFHNQTYVYASHTPSFVPTPLPTDNLADQGFGYVHLIVILSMLLPIGVAMFESLTCALLYILYFPWFICLIVFFLVFVPSYSFARFYDTTWGNRATGRDHEINEGREKVMKDGTCK